MSTSPHSPEPHGRWRGRRWRRGLGALVVLVVGGYAGGFAWFASIAGNMAVDPIEHTDAIVVLTGGSERLSTGLDLLASDRADKLFVSGVYHGVEVAELLTLSRNAPAELECCIVLGYSADDTAGNASETAAWIRREGFGSLRLVTSNYHMPRSLLEFREALPEVEIRPHPVSPATVHLDDWWLWPGTAQLIFIEYNKFLVAYLRIMVGRVWTTAVR